MVKGFKDSKGKFRPTGNKSSGVSSKQIKNKKSVLPSSGKALEIREKKSNDKLKRNKMDLDEDELAEMPFQFIIRVLNDKKGIDVSERRLKSIRLPVMNLEDINLEKAVHQALRELKERGIVPENAKARFDSLGYEGRMLDVYIKDDQHDTYDLLDHDGIRMSVEAYVDPEGEFSEEQGDYFDESEAQDILDDKLQEQFKNQRLSGRTIE